MKLRRTSRLLTVESLESRALLAGDVDLIQSGGALRMTGDKLANSLLVFGTGPESVEVIAVDGTTLNNGSATALTYTGVRALNILLAAGTDALEISGVDLPGRIDANLGKGDDWFSASFSRAHTMLVDGSDNNDTVSIGPVMRLADTLDIELGPGNDNLCIEDFFDECGEGGCGGGGEGGEFDFVAQYLKVDASKGLDHVNIHEAIFGAANIDGSDSVDDVCITDAAFVSLMVDLGKGNDRLAIAHTLVLGRAALNGSTGVDTLSQPDPTDSRANSFGSQLITSFESRLIDNEIYCDCGSDGGGGGGGGGGAGLLPRRR